MTTYNTYQEAKIANPTETIYQLSSNGKFISCELDAGRIRDEINDSDAVKCNPADHCITLEKFLADGHKLVEGDVICDRVTTKNITKNIADAMSSKSRADSRIFILRAAALETKEPKRTKVEWECVHHSEAVHYFGVEGFHLYDEPNGSEYNELQDYINNLQDNGTSSLYRRIETEITEREEFIETYGKLRNEFANQSEVVDFCEFMIDSKLFKLAN